MFWGDIYFIHYYFTFIWYEILNELSNNASLVTVPFEIREPCYDFG
jgi:hypothetical protein